jgi:putative membrane protein
MHWYDGMYGHNMTNPLGWIVMVLFWLFIIAGIILLIKNLRQPPESRKETPLEIAKRRYAEGEISKEEFETMKKDLSS